MIISFETDSPYMIEMLTYAYAIFNEQNYYNSNALHGVMAEVASAIPHHQFEPGENGIRRIDSLLSITDDIKKSLEKHKE